LKKKNFKKEKIFVVVSDVVSRGLLSHLRPLHLALGPNRKMVVFSWSFDWKSGYNLSVLIIWMTCWAFGFKSY